MTLKIESGGRIVIPKPIRDRLGLHAGRDIEVIETPAGLLLKSALPTSIGIALLRNSARNKVDGFSACEALLQYLSVDCRNDGCILVTAARLARPRTDPRGEREGGSLPCDPIGPG